MAQFVKTGFYVRTIHSHTLPGGRRCFKYTYQLAGSAVGALMQLTTGSKTQPWYVGRPPENDSQPVGLAALRGSLPRREP
jgi:hypothetical protein